MQEIIGYCGFSCHLCAARSDDPAVRQKLVDGWRRFFGHERLHSRERPVRWLPQRWPIGGQDLPSQAMRSRKGRRKLRLLRRVSVQKDQTADGKPRRDAYLLLPENGLYH